MTLIPPAQTKKCNKCGIDKPLADFHKCPCRPDGRHTYCKTCRNRVWRGSYQPVGQREEPKGEAYSVLSVKELVCAIINQAVEDVRWIRRTGLLNDDGSLAEHPKKHSLGAKPRAEDQRDALRFFSDGRLDRCCDLVSPILHPDRIKAHVFGRMTLRKEAAKESPSQKARDGTHPSNASAEFCVDSDAGVTPRSAQL